MKLKRIVILQAAVLAWCVNVGAQSGTPPTAGGADDVFTSASFSPNGKRIAVGSFEGVISVWDATTGKRLRLIQPDKNRPTPWLRKINTVRFSPNGRLIASGGIDGWLRLWDASSGKLVRTFKGHRTSIDSVSFSPNGRRLASGNAPDGAKVWDVATGKLLRTLGNGLPANAVAFSPNGRQIVGGGGYTSDTSDNLIGVRVWDAGTGKLLRTIGGKQAAHSVSFRRDGSQVATDYLIRGNGITQESKSGFRVMNLATGRTVRTVALEGATHVELSPDGRRVAVCGYVGESGALRPMVSEVATGKLRVLGGQEDSAGFVSFSPDGKRILSGGSKRIVLWDAATGKRLRTLR